MRDNVRALASIMALVAVGAVALVVLRRAYPTVITVNYGVQHALLIASMFLHASTAVWLRQRTPLLWDAQLLGYLNTMSALLSLLALWGLNRG